MNAQTNRSASVLCFGSFEVDLHNDELRKHGMRVKLQDQPFHILEILLERQGNVVTRDELRERLWPADIFVDFDHSLNTAINKLRNALDDSAERPRYIETLPRRGYRFVAPVAGPVENTTSGSSVRAAPASPGSVAAAARLEQTSKWTPGSVSPQKGIRAGILIPIVLLLAAAVGEPGKPPTFASGAPRIESLAVLPFENLSACAGQDSMVDVVTESLIAQLAMKTPLRVASRTSVLQYKGVYKPLPVIARELNVDAIVTGTLQCSGRRVHISVQLLHGPSDYHLWANEYERDVGDVLDFEAEVVQVISADIGDQILRQKKERPARRNPAHLGGSGVHRAEP